MPDAIACSGSDWRPPAPYPRAEPPNRWRLVRTVGDDLLATWSSQAFELPVLSWRMFGNESVLINDPALIRHVLVDNQTNYEKSVIARRLLGPGVGNGLLLSEGAVWQRQRRTLAPAFTPRAIAALVPTFVAATDDALAHWPGQGSGQGSGQVDGLRAVERLTLDIAARTMFSTALGPRVDRFASLVEEFQHTVGRPNLLDMLAAGGLNPLPDFLRAGFRRRWRAMIDGFIAERRAAPGTGAGTPRDVLDILLSATDPETGAGFTPEEIRDQVGTMLAAGFETTAMALYWTLYILGCRPDVQERARAEATSADLSAEGAAAAAERMPYLIAVILESLRLYPPAHTVSRLATGPDRLGPVQVRQGTTVLISPYVLQRHRRLWRDPDIFRAERFLPGSDEANRPYTWLPFGGGPRICIGMAFARVEMAVVVAKILSRYRLTVPDPAAVRPVGKVTILPVGDTRLTVERLG